MIVTPEIAAYVRPGQTVSAFAEADGYPSSTLQPWFKPNPLTAGLRVGATTGEYFDDTDKGIIWVRVYNWRTRNLLGGFGGTERVREWGWVNSAQVMAKEGASLIRPDDPASSGPTPTVGDARLLADFKRDYPTFPVPVIVREGGKAFYSWKGQTVEIAKWDGLPLSQKNTLSSGKSIGDLSGSLMEPTGTGGSGSGLPAWQIGLFGVLGTAVIGGLIYLFATQKKKKNGR